MSCGFRAFRQRITKILQIMHVVLFSRCLKNDLGHSGWVSGLGDDEVFEWTSPAGIGVDWSTRVRALLGQECSPPPPQVLELASRSGSRGTNRGI